MDTKTYLGQVRWLNRRIENKLAEIYRLRVMISNASAIPIENDKVQKSRNTDILGDTVSKIVDKEREVDKLVDTYIEKRDLIVKQIDGMDDIDMYHILSLRYVRGMSFRAVGESTGWSLSQTKRIHNKAIAAFDARYGDTYKES